MSTIDRDRLVRAILPIFHHPHIKAPMRILLCESVYATGLLTCWIRNQAYMVRSRSPLNKLALNTKHCVNKFKPLHENNVSVIFPPSKFGLDSMPEFPIHALKGHLAPVMPTVLSKQLLPATRKIHPDQILSLWSIRDSKPDAVGVGAGGTE